MRTLLILSVVLGFSALFAFTDSEAIAATVGLIMYGGQVLTMVDPEPDPAPSALAISGDRIVAVGDDASIMQLRGEGTQVIDLNGAVVIPGFIDGHAHLYGLGKALGEINLTGTGSAAEIVDMVSQAATRLPDLAWLQGRGWDQNDWSVTEFPDKTLLDAVVADRPVLLKRVDGHAAWVNSEALRRAGIDASTPDPDGGAILRTAGGEPTGILIDNGVDLVADIIPPVGPAERRRRIELAVEHCLQHGLTGVHDAGMTWPRVELYQEMAATGGLHMRVYGMLGDDSETLERGLAAGPYVADDQMFIMRTVKLFADGALGSRGALLLADFNDDPGNSGLQVTSTEHMREVIRKAGRSGFQVSTHAIGDRANRLILDLYEQVLGELGLEGVRWRIEHAQILDPADLPRFAELDVIAAMQPVHCTSDMDWAPERLGQQRLTCAYAWRELLDSGARVSFGTDFPVELVDPLHGLYSARTRTHHDGTPSGGWYPQQCVDGRTALRLYTAGVAYSAFQENDLGTIEVGKLADLTVLSLDPTSCQPSALLSAQYVLTIVGGKIRHDGR